MRSRACKPSTASVDHLTYSERRHSTGRSSKGAGPVAFLTDEQRRSNGTFTGVPDDGQLAGYFLLDRDARRRMMACRDARSQLGYSVQLGTVRFLGTFLDNPEHVPAEVVAYVADQLGHSPSVLTGYGAERTRWDHQDAIKQAYGYTGLKGEAWWKLARAVGPVLVGGRAPPRPVRPRHAAPGGEQCAAARRHRARAARGLHPRAHQPQDLAHPGRHTHRRAANCPGRPTAGRGHPPHLQAGPAAPFPA
ncbi:DUF4158 domain-containing protein [Streptomyces sp. NPDC004250]|uniref:DUF4158 domain-containing protein n=1 Tax=Streptomyces sp. NPDC004250 TaxID=3364692 RepID=UPI0036C5892B